MADNVAITAGAGTTVATDDVGGVQYQRVKPAVGADGTAVDVSAAAPMPSNVTDGTSVAGVTPAGFVRTTDEPTTIFYDPFDAALDTTNYWTTPTVGNSAVLATVTTGTMSMGTGTTASGWSKLFSQASFKLQVPGWTGFSFALTIPDLAAPTANAYRFWGSGTPATTPTTAAPMTNAVGFELATDGKMYAVVYAGGTRTVVQDLSAATGNSKQPTTATAHRYIVQVRTDKSYFYIDGVSAATLVATADFISPQVQTLPITFVAVGGATPPATNAQIQCAGSAVWDTSKSSMSISDPDYAWRQAAVQAVVPVGTELGLITRQAGAIPTGANTIGAIKPAVVQTATSNLTAAAQAQTITLQGEAALAVQISGTWVGTVTFEASNDNTNYTTVNAQRAGDNTITQTVTNTAGNDLYRIGVAGFLYVRIRCSAYTSGTIVVTSSTSLAAASAVLGAALPAGTNAIGTVAQATLTKNTQGATGVSTQDLHNAGRNITNYFHAAPIITTTGEVMQTLTGYKSGAAVAATATPAVVTTGKTYRITRVTIAYTAATVIGGALIRLRANLSGTGAVGSPLVLTWQVGMPAIFTAGAEMTYVFEYPEGLEFAAGTGIAVGVIGAGAVPTTGTVTGYVLLAIEGYEY